ncbi:MAG: biotin transporter BioY [Alphaproteobacteria bacterium]|nr:biotin transporter BioY [Alphaproteobacteria bacterium]MBU1524962.1 biotin transporter BioY [Alphaproteobacteria bacterium]MBU2116894.1 biotin transporter BioY [Alphaproteobacteria bacterium]MBU2350320.1 biotin transporter BioY [Alphaproteobacteria bacterium]MBU2381795.1 biotin transporter BioY [Alphaproteobacteria bacterium]
MSALTHSLLALAFAALMALGAQVDVPMHPVPMTMQSFAVLLAGAALGPAWGVVAVLIYLGAAALGLPVLSEGAGALGPFTGATAGYIFAFPVAAGLAGLARRRGLLDRLPVGTAVLFCLHLLLLAMGGGWLATKIGAADAWTAGVRPFLIGAAVKSVLVLAALAAWRRLTPQPRT